MEQQQSLLVLARDQWKQHRPKFYQRLKDAGNLDVTLQQAVEQVQEFVHQQISQGKSQDEAWEQGRKKLALYVPKDEQF